MLISNLMNQLLKIIGIWTIYLLVFANGRFSFADDQIFVILTTVFYILATLFFLWRIKNPSRKMRSEARRISD
ncbi:hypothetical protein BHE17_07950 [Planococcus maritimus]|nr:hypothetical protein BHE17_07950 [Planococcus maritimus]